MLKLTIRNYRNISADEPLELTIGNGITFVLGVNNVGKSNLLRLFHEFQPVFERLKKEPSDIVSIVPRFDSIIKQGTSNKATQLSIEHSTGTFHIDIQQANPQNFQQVLAMSKITEGLDGLKKFQKIMSDLARVLYIGPIRSQLAQPHFSLNNFLTGSNFITQWHEWANGEDVGQREQMRLFVRELQELFGFKNFNVRVSKQSDTLLVTTDDGDFKLQELGDGISHFIVVLGNVLFKRPSLVLIDEPENGLHPKMQELFIRSLASKCEFGLLATSHAIGLARSVADQILVITRTPKGPKISPFGDHSQLTISQSISELGYSQFAQLGGNHLLLVEGRTEIKSFREILRKYSIEQHFIIWSLGGADFINGNPERIVDELNELKRLNAKSISVVFDSERTSASAPLATHLAAFHKISSELGFETFSTDRHSTENYITQAAITSAIGNGYKALGPFEKFGSTGTKWNKSQNWKMFREMNREDFAGTELDRFITQTLIPKI
jgi:ABC-type cobalamin/Fe3+-siderophores transport system ATPase subunit